MDGLSEYQGRVEIWYHSQWNTVCDDAWDLIDATVVCHQLGYRGAVTAHLGASFGRGSGQILLDNLHCTGREASLLECRHSGINVHNCRRNQDASVTCECECNWHILDSCYCAFKFLHNKTMYIICAIGASTRFSSGSLRLANGYASSVGRVEIWFSNQWNTVCDDYWNIEDANVACRQLGFGSAALTAHQSAYFGQGTGQILLDELDCNGTEASLLQCTHIGLYYHDCGHYEDASVTCE